MFREQWDQWEEKVQASLGKIRDSVLSRAQGGATAPVFNHDDFVQWGKEHVEKLKKKADSQKTKEIRENFFVLLRNLGVNDQLLRESFQQNKKEFLDPLIGESIAVIALVLGWKQKDKEMFSQALGEIGVVGIFAAKPIVCLIALCGLAYGYNRHFHKEAFKKGSVLGFAGLTVACFSPGGFIGLLAAIVVMVYLNKKLSVEKPIESQLKEILQKVRRGDFFKEMRQSWQKFEDFLGDVFTPSKESPSYGDTNG